MHSRSYNTWHIDKARHPSTVWMQTYWARFCETILKSIQITTSWDTATSCK